MGKKFKEIVFEETYTSFKDFYSDNNEIIYQGIIELFQEFVNTKKKKLTLFIRGQINEIVWDTEFNFTREESFILTRDLLPYFESVEDYETCLSIKKTYESLNNKKNEKVQN
jgi:hypothetical protein